MFAVACSADLVDHCLEWITALVAIFATCLLYLSVGKTASPLKFLQSDGAD